MIHVVLLAAGGARRMRRAKQLLPIDGVPMVRRAAHAAEGVGARLVLVTGAWGDDVAAALEGIPHERVHNAAWEHGMGGSIACAFTQLLAHAPESEAGIVVLADQPLVGAETLARLVRAHRSAPDRIIAADHGGRLGPPCLFPRLHYAELAALSGPEGARTVLERHATRVDAVLLPEAACDIDTPADLARLEARR